MPPSRCFALDDKMEYMFTVTLSNQGSLPEMRMGASDETRGSSLWRCGR